MKPSAPLAVTLLGSTTTGALALVPLTSREHGDMSSTTRDYYAASALPAGTDCSAVTCVAAAAGVAHIIVTRASTEAPGAGVLGSVADAVVAACPGSDVATNPYPALLDPYLSSEAAGVGNLTESTFRVVFFGGGEGGALLEKGEGGGGGWGEIMGASLVSRFFGAEEFSPSDLDGRRMKKKPLETASPD